MSAFTALHVHSHYSLLKALPKLPDLVKAAKDAGCEALALTDLGNLYGTVEFVMECRKQGIKPIIGIDVILEETHRLILLCENEQGYRNLLALVTEANLASEPGLTREILKRHASGLIALGNFLRAEHTKQYEEIFGAKNFYATVATSEVYYLSPDDRRAWQVLRAVGGIEVDGDISSEDEDFAFPTAEAMHERFTSEELALTNDIAARCNVELVLGKFIFPEFPLPPNKTADALLRELCLSGMKERGLEDKPDVLERLEYELDIIKFKGYAMYFLVVEDLIRFAREHDIYTNIRGSVAGSMTTYLLQITKIDPLEYKIPFERFLNPERPSAPDIDMDFADDRRDEVIRYTRQKYGEDHVAQIGTFGTMLARGVVRDVARALRYPYGLGDRIAKEIPMGSQGFPMTLERALEENPELKKMYENEDETREIIELGQKIEGCARHVGVHAAGVVISPRPLVAYAPLQLDPKGGKIITQYDMYSVGEEAVGLTKFDFLGIRNLTILASAIQLIEKIRGVKIDIEEIPLDDKKTFQMLARGETEGTFQLNGSGMTKWLVELQPSTIHDINAMVALYRPGPMENIPEYVRRKHNPQMVSYLDPRMREYLGFSNGVIVYQDDVLLTAITLGGYSWLDADKLRKAMGKKIPEVMQAEKEKLISSFIEYGKLSSKLAETLWKLIEPFAAYGFGKAHAASYGRVAYQTAYLKANFPVEYMSAVLTNESGNIDTVATMVAECKRMNINILPPDINESFGDFTVVGAGSQGALSLPRQAPQPTTPPVSGAELYAEAKFPSPSGSSSERGELRESSSQAIRFGLYSIKNFGSGVADSIIAERKKNGKFISLADFLSRVTDQNLNKKGLESLVECGALDSFGERGQMLASIELLLQYHRDTTRDSSQDSLFAAELGPAELKLPPALEASTEQRLVWEKELLGLYISGHPLDKFKERLAKRNMTLGQLKERVKPGVITVTGGMIEDVRVVMTRNGDQMAFIRLADYDGSIEAVVFPKSYAEHKSIIQLESCIALRGKLSSRNGELSLVAEGLKAL